jgi:7-cyano-7-deazaguanine synthase
VWFGGPSAIYFPVNSAGLLLSGGMDSAALAYQYKPSICYTIDYGQRSAEGEIRAAVAIADCLGLTHHVLRIDCSSLGSGLLSGRPPAAIAPVPEWWPFRNQLLVTLVATHAVGAGVKEIWIGTVSSDARHADGTLAFINCLNALLRLQEGELSLCAPAIELSSLELIHRSRIPKSILAYAHSCHTADLACGECPGCLKHLDVTRLLYGDEGAY